MIRIKITKEFFYLFLVWNLFLATIPFIITLGLEYNKLFRKNKRLFFSSFIIWLLFLPNSFYLITDLKHLRLSPQYIIWFDSIILFSFSITGFLLGYFSINNIKLMLTLHLSKKQISFLINSIFFLCGFGIYLGRFLRWNSWDIASNPIVLFKDIILHLNPLTHPESWIITFSFGAFFLVLYSLFNKMKIVTTK